jgi:hypothetical protein
MSKWGDWVCDLEIKDDLETLIEEVRSEIKKIKAKNLAEQDKLDTVAKTLFEAKFKAKELEYKNKVLSNRISILEEDLDL